MKPSPPIAGARLANGHHVSRLTLLILLACPSVFPRTAISAVIPYSDGDHYVAGPFAAGDFDRDGYPDFVTTEGSNLVVWENDRSGHFSRAGTFAAGGTVFGFAAADIDGDGVADVLALVSDTSTTLVLFRGTGDGGLARTSEYALPAGGFRVMAKDLDGDGRPDAVVYWCNDNNFVVWKNRGGTLQNAGTYSTPDIPFAIAAADFDRDGRVDLAVACFRHISIFTNTGGGNFIASADYAASVQAQYAASGLDNSEIAAGDLDGDGWPDIVVDTWVPTIETLWNDGTGRFQETQEESSRSYYDSFTIADLDHDGRNDLVMASFPGHDHMRGITIWYGNGSRSLTRREYINGFGQDAYEGNSVSVLDLNGDGNPDIATGSRNHYGVRDLTVLRSLGGRSFAGIAAYYLPTGVTSVTAVDFQGNGRPDLLVGRNGQTVRYRFGPDGTPGAPENFAAIDHLSSFDFNRDRRGDIYWNSGDTLCVELCQPDGSLGPASCYDTGGDLLCTGDFNRDGWPDLAVAQSDGTIATMLNDGTGHFAPPTSSGVSLPYGLSRKAASGDLDGDGYDDLAVIGFAGPDTLWVLRNEKNGAFSIQARISRDCNNCDKPEQDFAADLDHDGRMDLVLLRGYGSQGGYYTSYFNRGGWGFSPDSAGYAASEDPVGQIADVNLDGWPDMINRSRADAGDGVVQLHLNRGNGEFDDPITFILASCPPTDMTVGDFNGDGTPDLAVGFWSDPDVGFSGFAVFLNTAPQQPTAAVVSLIESHAEVDRVTITWSALDAGTTTGTVQRRTGDRDWTSVATLARDAGGRFAFVDRAVEPGTRYVYRLTLGGVSSADVIVNVPALDFALEPVRPNPTTGIIAAAFTLTSARPATVELLDIGGRRVDIQSIASPAIGRNTVQLAQKRALAPGLYWVRLRQESRTAITRVAVIR